MQLDKKEIKFETLKKSHKKQIVIGVIAICLVGGVLTFRTTRAKYKVTQSVNIVNGIINYKPYDFKIMAMYKSDGEFNYIEIEDMPGNDYTINEEKSYCNMTSGDRDTGAILKTINGNHTIGKLKKNDRCYFYFDKKEATSEDTLAKLNITNVNTTTPTFSNVATTDEGVFRVEDGMYGGYSYYFRGAVTNNHVIFANKCWRIIRINGDGSIRLIYNGAVLTGNKCTGNGTNAGSVALINQMYNISCDNNSYVGWTYKLWYQRPSSTTEGTETASNAKSQTESWFNTTITGTDLEKVADGKFCNDRNTKNNETWRAKTDNNQYYAGYARLINAKTPTLSCPIGDVYKGKVGLITADEVSYAGGVYGTGNTSYYLYNGQNYWTMSPSDWNSPYAQVFYVNSNGSLGSYGGMSGVTSSRNLRSVLNLKVDTTFNSGSDGSQNFPYIVQ